MIIDSHQHFWQYDPQRHGWIDDSMAVIQRDFLPYDLQKVYERNGVDGCVAVQVDQTETETDYLVKLAGIYDFIKGVVGWIDLRAENLPDRLDHFAGYDKLCGFRHIVQGETDVNFLLRPDFMEGIRQLHTYRFTYDVLVYPHQLGAVLEFVRNHPQQLFVIDHLAKPYIKDGFYDGWALLMRAIARQENVYCKLSGMVTEASWNTWTYQDLLPYMDLILEVFGPKRIMYGSDWPVCLVAGQYAAVKGVVEQYVQKLSPSEQAMIWGENAVRFYGLKQD
jgi:L-fuconolactonase